MDNRRKSQIRDTLVQIMNGAGLIVIALFVIGLLGYSLYAAMGAIQG